MESIRHTPAFAVDTAGRSWLFVAIAFCLSLSAALACYAAAGVSLGLFFGPMLLMPFLAPALVMGQQTYRWRLTVCAALFLGTWLIWLFLGNLPVPDLLRSGGVLLAFVVALAGCATALGCIRLSPTFSAALVTLLGAAWLTWPIWLSHWLSMPDDPDLNGTVHYLTFAHPLIVLNGSLYPRFDVWDRYTLTYQQLTTLNQDIIYTLPRSVGWMILLHLLPGLGGLALPRVGRRSPALLA